MMKTHILDNRGLLLRTCAFALVAAGASAAQPALAQGMGDADEVAAQNPADGNVIVVTATKRNEDIQDVPVSVASVGGEQMKETGIVDLADIATVVPNFEFSSTGVLPNLYVRGVGTGTSHSVEQSVGKFVDEVYIGRAAINLHPLYDVSSVEVLRGPQGTLFGKNTLAGAVIVNTADPTSSFEAGFDLSATHYSTVNEAFTAEGFVSGPLTDTLRGRLAVYFRDDNGYLDNILGSPDGAAQEDLNARLKLEWDVGPATEISLKGEYMSLDYAGQTMIETVGGVFPGGPMAGQPLPLETFTNFVPGFTFERDWKVTIDCDAVIQGTTFCPGRRQDTVNITLDIDHEIDGLGNLRSITAFQTYDFDFRFMTVDGGVNGGAARQTTSEEYESLTQEFRLTSEESTSFDYIVGVYLEASEIAREIRTDQDIASFLTSFPPGSLPPPQGIQEAWNQDTRTVAAFGQGRLWLTDTLSAILGARFSYEEKDFAFFTQQVAYGAPFDRTLPPAFDLSRSESRLTPALTLRYEPNPDLMLYLSYAQGHKTGGFSDRLQADPEFDAEVNNSFEAGIKATLFGGSLQANATIFRMEIDDLQVSRSIVGATNTFEVENAAKAVSQGIELEASWFANDNWTLGGNFSYTDATYKDYPGAAPQCPALGGFIGDDGLCNFAGLPLIFAPEFKATAFVGFDYPDAFGEWDIGGRVDVNYSSEFYPELTFSQNLTQDEYATVNASLRLETPDEKWRIALIGRNLTEQHVIAWGLTGGFVDFVAPRAPRELTLQIGYRY